MNATTTKNANIFAAIGESNAAQKRIDAIRGVEDAEFYALTDAQVQGLETELNALCNRIEVLDRIING